MVEKQLNLKPSLAERVKISYREMRGGYDCEEAVRQRSEVVHCLAEPLVTRIETRRDEWLKQIGERWGGDSERVVTEARKKLSARLEKKNDDLEANLDFLGLSAAVFERTVRNEKTGGFIQLRRDQLSSALELQLGLKLCPQFAKDARENVALEKPTGEGKTFVIALSAATEVVCGRMVHIVTPTYYHAEIHAGWLGKFYQRLLGEQVGVAIDKTCQEKIVEQRREGGAVVLVEREGGRKDGFVFDDRVSRSGVADDRLKPLRRMAERAQIYQKKIVVCDRNSVPFDCLEDNQKWGMRRGALPDLSHVTAIVDEGDQILDEAVNPWIIAERLTGEKSKKEWVKEPKKGLWEHAAESLEFGDEELVGDEKLGKEELEEVKLKRSKFKELDRDFAQEAFFGIWRALAHDSLDAEFNASLLELLNNRLAEERKEVIGWRVEGGLKGAMEIGAQILKSRDFYREADAGELMVQAKQIILEAGELAGIAGLDYLEREAMEMVENLESERAPIGAGGEIVKKAGKVLSEVRLLLGRMRRELDERIPEELEDIESLEQFWKKAEMDEFGRILNPKKADYAVWENELRYSELIREKVEFSLKRSLLNLFFQRMGYTEEGLLGASPDREEKIFEDVYEMIEDWLEATGWSIVVQAVEVCLAMEEKRDYLVQGGAPVLIDRLSGLPFESRQHQEWRHLFLQMKIGWSDWLREFGRKREEGEAHIFEEIFKEHAASLEISHETDRILPVELYGQRYGRLKMLSGIMATDSVEIAELLGADTMATKRHKMVDTEKQWKVDFGDRRGWEVEVTEVDTGPMLVKFYRDDEKKIRDILAMVESAAKRPVLWVVEDVQEAETFYAACREAGFPMDRLQLATAATESRPADTDIVMVHEGETKYWRPKAAPPIEEVFFNAGRKGMITIATVLGSRGVEINLDEVVDIGGLKLIEGSSMPNRRIFLQIAGRALRGENPGERVVCISPTDPNNLFLANEAFITGSGKEEIVERRRKKLASLWREAQRGPQGRLRLWEELKQAQKRREEMEKEARRSLFVRDGKLEQFREVLRAGVALMGGADEVKQRWAIAFWEEFLIGLETQFLGFGYRTKTGDLEELAELWGGEAAKIFMGQMENIPFWEDKKKRELFMKEAREIVKRRQKTSSRKAKS